MGDYLKRLAACPLAGVASEDEAEDLHLEDEDKSRGGPKKVGPVQYKRSVLVSYLDDELLIVRDALKYSI